MLAAPATVITCDSEPIHALGTIQPIGFLISVNADWIVVRASANVADYLSLPHAQIVGRSATDVLPVMLLHEIRGRLQQAGQAGVAEPMFGQVVALGRPVMSIAMHQAGHETILEFEEEDGRPAPLPTAVRAIIARVERHPTLPAVFREATRQVRALIGFDRVMVYQFHDDGHGEVVGESARNGLPSFMGLRYPASDIPTQARALYERNLVRIITDVAAEPVPVMPALSPEGEVLDMSMGILRSVSPVHVEYLRNMGVGASMSISILRGGRLWGLFACHHTTANHLGLQARLTAELFGQMFSYLMEVRVGMAEMAYTDRVLAIHNRIVAAFAAPGAAFSNIPEFISDLTDYVAADGIATFSAGELTLVGLTPTAEEFRQLLPLLNKTASGRIFATDRLSDVHPPAADYPMRAAGLLAIPISRMPRDYLVFFRRETLQTVTWAGAPVNPETVGPNGVRLTPRKSFEAWREMVLGRSTAWNPAELRAAESLRLTLVEVVMRMSDDAQADRLKGQHYQELLVAELNHRVRNLLGLVRGLLVQVAAKASDTQALVEGLDSRLRAMGRAYDLLTVTQWTTGSLHGLLHTEITAYQDRDASLVLIGPDVMLQPKAFSAMALVVHELVTNAHKYGALQTPAGQVVVATKAEADGTVAIGWSELGGPAVQPPTRRGFGTTVLEQAIPFETGGTCVLRFTATGFGMDMRLPAAAAATGAAAAAPAVASVVVDPPAGAVSEAPDIVALLDATLIVEDNLFIAIDAEDLLRQLGARTVAVARSVAEALEILAEQPVSFGMLDVNLGAETSLPIARALQAKGVAFIFGTGYGRSITLPDSMAATPVISKPYSLDAIRRGLGELDHARQGERLRPGDTG